MKVFGAMEKYEEINECAAGLLAEGDVENIRVLAKENGLDEELTELYVKGEIEELCDMETAALGRIDTESKELEKQEIIHDWIEYIRACIGKDEDMARAVMKKGKTVKGCISKLLVWSMKHMYQVDQEIIKAAGVKGQCKLGIPGMATAKKIIRKYYLGK